jgi:hypothetical protein
MAAMQEQLTASALIVDGVKLGCIRVTVPS